MSTLLGDGDSRPLKLFRSKSSILPLESGIRQSSVREPAALHDKIRDAVQRTQEYYVREQHEDGYWWYELESNVTITSEYLMLLHFLGVVDPEKEKKMAFHILKNQREDGTWALYWGGKGDLSTTIEAYFALKLAGFSKDDDVMRKAREFILSKGGVEAARVFTKIYLALFGEFAWRAIPSVPVEINLLPEWFPFGIYSLSSWARATIVPLTVIRELRPVRPVLRGEGVRELYLVPDRVPSITRTKLPPLSWKRLFVIADRVIKTLEAFPARPLRMKALRKTEEWIREHQEPCGDWGGIQPAMVNSTLALASLGYDVASEPIRKGLEALERFTIEDDRELVLQSCISPIWDTALTALAMISSGMKKDHRSLLKACTWLASKQIFRKGDWSVKCPSLEPGGWAFEFENAWYPDVDDTAVVLMLLYRYAGTECVDRGNLEKGLNWILGMQGKDGGWGAFDVNNDMNILNQLPFGDLEAMIDPSTADLTGRVLELLGLIGYGLSDEVVKRAIAFIRKNQEKDGSWWGRWGVNYIYGTGAVLVGLGTIGEDMTKPYVRKAVRWLKGIQNPDGGWGECCESYEETSLKCTGASTPSQTAWSILGLLAAGERASDELIRGVTFLLKGQKTDGTWEEKEYTGTGFPKYFLINYHNYRNCFPLLALGRFLSKTTEG